MARTRLRTIALVAVMSLLATVAAISPAAAQRERARAGDVTLFPTDVTIAATQLLANDGFVYCPAESSDGNTFYVARVDQAGQLERAEVPSVSPLVATTDGAVWQAASTGGALPQGNPATALIGADPLALAGADAGPTSPTRSRCRPGPRQRPGPCPRSARTATCGCSRATTTVTW